MSQIPRLFLEKERFLLEVGANIPLLSQEINYLIHVLRLPHQALVHLLDGQGCQINAFLLYKGKDLPTFQVNSVVRLSSSAKAQITLVQGLVKHDKMEWIIQKATELGASRMIPIGCERSVVQLDEKRAALRVHRWNEIAKHAAQQCRRSDIPSIEPILTFQEFIKQPCVGTKLFFWEEPLGCSLHEVLSKFHTNEVFLFVGPEGGFSEKEVELAKNAGWHICTLGTQILRAETAALAALAIVMHELRRLYNL